MFLARESLISSACVSSQFCCNRGNFSVVKLGMNRRTGEKVAIKVINKRKYWHSNILDQVAREVDILKKIRHENIISIIEIISTGILLFTTSSSNCPSTEKFLYIVLEL